MADTASSSISRYKPAVVLLTSLAAAGSIWYIFSSRHLYDGFSAPSLQRRGAIRRRQNLLPVHRDDEDDAVEDALLGRQLDEDDVALQQFFDVVPASDSPVSLPRALAAGRDEDETERSVDSQESAGEGERLKELVYAIAKHNHERDGIEHHGVSCDSCGMRPILGPRYHCANCPDFDLCEACEAQDCHLRTHVFFKVKIPAPWGGKDPLPLWYPGHPHKMPDTIDTEGFRASRAELSECTGFSISKIDGFYQQFTCMANVPFDDAFERSGISMAIGRASFDHCFMQQITMDRSLGPCLVADRLFALYDANKDGVIDFSEFVHAMSLIRGKKPEERVKRIFKGFDLDDDGMLERKDFLKMFRSFYTLNNEIFVGYFKAEQVAQNADLLGTTRDVDGHLAGGRSLASYFGDGAPNFEPNAAWSSATRPDGKISNGDHDLVLADANRPVVQPEWDWQDLSLTMDGIERDIFIYAFYVFHDEMLRVTNGLPMKYLDPDRVRIFETETDLMLREADEAMWVLNFDWRMRRKIYLRLEDGDVETETGWRDMVDDEEYCRRFYDIVKVRMCHKYLPGPIKEQAEDRTSFNHTHRRFMLNDIDTTDEAEGPTTGQIQVSSDEGLSTFHEIPNRYAAEQLPADLVGGTAANHTISNVVMSALNEMLNPIFAMPEALVLEEEATVDERDQHKAAILAHLDSLFETHWKPHDDSWQVSYKSDDSARASPRDRNSFINEHKARLRDEPTNYGASMVYNFARFSAGYEPDESVETWRRALMWSLAIEASIWVEDKWEHEKTARQAARTVATTDRPSLPLAAEDQVLGDLLLQTDTTKANPQSQSSTDPTMPQNRPSDDALSAARLHHLTVFHVISLINAASSAPAGVDFDQFQRSLAIEDEKGAKLLDWTRGWVDLIIF